MIKKSCLAVLIAFMLAMSVALAANLEVKHKGPSYVQAGAEATFIVTVKNNAYKEEVLDLHVDPLSTLPSSWFEYVILDKNRFHLKSGQEAKFNVSVKLKNDVPTDDNYATHIVFTSPFDSAYELEHGFILRVVPPEDILDMSVSVPDKIQPGGDYVFDVMLKNNLNTQLHNVRLAVSSELFNEEKSMKFFALQDRTERFSFKIPALAEPVNYDLNVKVFYNEDIIERSTAKFRVLENSDVKEKRQVTIGFMTKTFVITKTNYGNSKVKERFEVELTKWQKMFVDYSEEPAFVDEKGAHWAFQLNPDSSKSVTVVVNYRPLGIAVVVAVIFIFLVYFWFTRTVSIKKDILKVSETKEGISELKILLHVKNRTARTLRHLAIVEILPKVIEPTKGFGTLKPEKVQKGDKGIRLMWIVPELVKGEERIISYKVRSKINIVGTFMLPPAKIRYRSRTRKAITVESHPVKFTVGSGQKKAKA